MATLDVIINSLSDKTFWVPKYHWGSWNKILSIHGKDIKTFNDFDIRNVEVGEGVVMLCYPSNPTGYAPKFEDLKAFTDVCKAKGQTLILDLPYYYLFNEMSDRIYELYSDNVIIISSFSKSVGLSGLRVGYIATKSKELYDTMKIRSLYKYNSISTVPQEIINQLLTSNQGQTAFDNYRRKTKEHVTKNIQYLSKNGLLFDVGDDDTALKSMNRLYLSKSLRTKFAQEGMKTYKEKFTLHKMIHRYNQLLFEVSPPQILIDLDGIR
jgi:aspartate/methionine/tyrosine aminotransferase